MSKHKTIWLKESNNEVVQTIDQRFLPHKIVVEDLSTAQQAFICIKDMHTRGAGLIGNVAAYGIYLATLEAANTSDFSSKFNELARMIRSARPTAVNLMWAVDRMVDVIGKQETIQDKVDAALLEASKIADEDAEISYNIGLHGLKIIEEIGKRKNGGRVNVLTHCNAGWLAYIDHGTATAPIYLAKEKGIDIHVWVDETRPRNQGANLTAWEMLQGEVPHTLIPDNTGGHLMQNGMVDIVIVGTDRTSLNGDVANKIGTYLKALAASDNNVPFYVALPSSTIDWDLEDGLSGIPIEERDEDEVKYIYGMNDEANVERVLITNKQTPAANYGFDVTPARLITGLITERGVCKPDKESILKLFPEKL